MAIASFPAPLHPVLRRVAHWRHRARGTSLYQPLLRQHRVIFIHVPKTGGQSVCQALFGNPDHAGHIPLADYERENPVLCAVFTKCGFVRNPYARLLSAYTYLMRHSAFPADIALRETVLARYTDFADFILRGLSEDAEVRQWWHFRPQMSFLCLADGRMGLDFVGRHESLMTDYARLRARLGFGADLPWLNAGSGGDYRAAYNDGTAAVAERFYQTDLAQFGYTFG